MDFYNVLRVPRDAMLPDLKQAYHHILLSSHPDKRKLDTAVSPSPDIGLIQQAYSTLSNPEARKEYDALLAAVGVRSASGPRPAHILSLEEFSESIDDRGNGYWTYTCRCGGIYRMEDAQLEDNVHLVGCDSCSEMIWVGYEAQAQENPEDVRKKDVTR